MSEHVEPLIRLEDALPLVRWQLSIARTCTYVEMLILLKRNWLYWRWRNFDNDYKGIAYNCVRHMQFYFSMHDLLDFVLECTEIPSDNGIINGTLGPLL